MAVIASAQFETNGREIQNDLTTMRYMQFI